MSPEASIVREPRTTDGHALERLVAALHADLCRAVDREIGAAGTARPRLLPGILVDATYVELREVVEAAGVDRKSFLALAARVLRHVLVTSLRRRSDPDSSPLLAVPSDLPVRRDHGVELALANEALARLGQRCGRAERVAELRIFGGLSCDEVAEVLGLLPQLAREDWRIAARELGTSL